jgi:cyclic-di-GMP phosphodiesterase TipF (flagellum assembly factor)
LAIGRRLLLRACLLHEHAIAPARRIIADPFAVEPMLRLAAIFIVVCMALIAGSLGAVLYLTTSISLVEAALVAVALFAALAFYHFVFARMRDRENVSQQIADLSRGTADLARQVGELGRRVVALESAAAKSGETIALPGEAAAEIGELGVIVKKLAEQVALHDALFATTGKPPASRAAPNGGRQPRLHDDSKELAFDPADLDEAETEAASADFPASLRHLNRDGVISLIRGAVEENRIDIFLQPIVSLPQRKVRFYEALARLRLENGEVLTPGDFFAFAQDAGLVPRIDNLMLFRSVQVVRRLLAKNREIGVFCNIAQATLADPEFFPQLSEFLEANRALSSSLVLEFSQRTMRDLTPAEQERLARLGESGFRFSLDGLVDLRLEPRELAERGFRFVKVPARLLLNRMGHLASDIHAADFSDLLGRFGIDLVAVHIESETTVVDLLDYDVRFGQGFLFSPPRPVRPEAMESGAGGKPAAPRVVVANAPADELSAQGGADEKASEPPPHSPAPGRSQRAAGRTGAR